MTYPGAGELTVTDLVEMADTLIRSASLQALMLVLVKARCIHRIEKCQAQPHKGAAAFEGCTGTRNASSRTHLLPIAGLGLLGQRRWQAAAP